LTARERAYSGRDAPAPPAALAPASARARRWLRLVEPALAFGGGTRAGSSHRAGRRGSHASCVAAVANEAVRLGLIEPKEKHVLKKEARGH